MRIHCVGVKAVTPLNHEGCTLRGWGIHEATIGKELCGALLGSSTSAYHWVGAIRNGSWYRECSVFLRTEIPVSGYKRIVP